MGRLGEVTVVCRQWELVGPVVESILGNQIGTPQPEKEFRVRVGDYERFAGYLRMRLLFLLGTTDDTVLVGILGERLESLPVCGYGLYRVRNAWARNQWVVLLIARNDSQLVTALRFHRMSIRQLFYDIVIEQMRAATYYRPADRQKSEELGRRYGFSIEVPRDWRLDTSNDTARFVYMFGHYPDRSLFVHWSDTVPVLSVDSLCALRNRLTRTFYAGDVINADEVVVADSITFLGGVCVRLRGVWQNPREIIGGPFVSYSFVYQGRFFMLDGTLFNPGERKLENLYQLEAIIRTFTPYLK